MNRLDDDVVAEFSDIVARLNEEFSQLQPPIEVSAHKRRSGKILVAAAVAAAIAIVPTLGVESSVTAGAWAAVPTVLSSKDLAEIKELCLKNLVDPSGIYQSSVADFRASTGVMLLTADRGEAVPANERFATWLCEFEKKNGKFTTPGLQGAIQPNLNGMMMWGRSHFAGLEIWEYVAAVTPDVAKVVITDSQGLEFEASINFGYALAWWPQHEGEAENGGKVTFLDANDEVVKTTSLNMNAPEKSSTPTS